MDNYLRVRKEAITLARHVSLHVCRVRGLNRLYTHYSILQQLTSANAWLLGVAVDDSKSIQDIYAELPRLSFPVAFAAIGDGVIRALWDRLVYAIALEVGEPVPTTMDQADMDTRHALLPVVSQPEWLSMCQQTPYFGFRRRLMGEWVLEALPADTLEDGDKPPYRFYHSIPAR